MVGFRQVLAYVNPELPDQPVLDLAMRVVDRLGRVDLIHVVEVMPWYSRILRGSETLHMAQVVDARERLDQLARPLRARGLQTSTSVVRGKRSLEVTRSVIAHGYDLLLKEAEAEHPGELGTSDLRLLRSCPCPVWIVRAAGRARMKCVLAAVNPRAEDEEYDPFGIDSQAESHIHSDPEKENALNRHIVDLAIWAAFLDGGEVHVVHAWRVPGEERLRCNPHADQGEVEVYVRGIGDEARARFESLVAPFQGRGVSLHPHFVKGHPAEAIAELQSRAGVDLLVMGTVARTGIAGYVIGNTAETVLARANCSLLAIKPEGFVSPVRPAEEGGPVQEP
jgi:nucleotide-binding universal stress UspA family protein